MFNNSRTHQDEYIREYAFEPELLINREEYLREEERARKLPSTPVRLRWDEAIAKQKEQQKRTASQTENASDDKNQIEFEIEAFYYVSPWPSLSLLPSLSLSLYLRHPFRLGHGQTFAKTSEKLAMLLVLVFLIFVAFSFALLYTQIRIYLYTNIIYYFCFGRGTFLLHVQCESHWMNEIIMIYPIIYSSCEFPLRQKHLFIFRSFNFRVKKAFLSYARIPLSTLLSRILYDTIQYTITA